MYNNLHKWNKSILLMKRGKQRVCELKETNKLKKVTMLFIYLHSIKSLGWERIELCYQNFLIALSIYFAKLYRVSKKLISKRAEVLSYRDIELWNVLNKQES